MMKYVLLIAVMLGLAACVGDVVRGAADVGAGAVDVVTAPIP